MFASEYELTSIIDHTLLKPEANKQEILRLCKEALNYRFHSVFLLPCYLPVAVRKLRKAPVKVGTVIGFPLGGNSTTSKIFEAIDSLRQGAEELDIVINIGALKSGDFPYLERELKGIISKTPECLHKVIVEVGLLTEGELKRMIEVVNRVKPAFVKTSTGFLARGARVEDVVAIRHHLHPDIGIKASGGIRTLQQVTELVEAGASRIGTSAGVDIMQEYRRKSGAG
ncbi:deoxyribose-phosphate aldolase [bacterium (candidate division B38) B3_B38]|nr:MAG: deoxyribose-phosphate aldolase [bacterium (candidate division B38) B3_B38]